MTSLSDMYPETIYRFRLKYTEHRIVRQDKNEVRIKRYNDAAQMWEDMMMFDWMDAFEEFGRVGHFFTRNNHWWFKWNDWTETECELGDFDPDMIYSMMKIYELWVEKS